ncbi:MAG: hypothetical protein CMN06_01185 [Roseibacillus sp.]|nr:hypothetical protein [Roseibacillus sp.]
MRNLCFLCSAALIILGLVGYLGWEAIGASKQSVTALIPAFIGLPMLLGGLVALKSTMAGMHIAVLFSALGALAGLGRVIPTVIEGGFSGPGSVLIAIMTAICLFFTVMAIRSFRAARRNREASA